MFRRVGALGVTGAAIAAVVAMTLSGTASARTTASASTSCNSPLTIGVAYPATGDAAGIGALQWDWANAAANAWNSSHSLKISLLPGDTHLGPGEQAQQVAQSFANNSSIVAVTGPAGSQEMQDTAAIWKAASLAPISGSETRVELTRSQGASKRQTTKGYFYRTVPNDGQQGGDDARYIYRKLHIKNVEVIDDQENYSIGLAGQVTSALKKFHVHVTRNSISQTDTNFSSVIDAIPSSTKLIYIPWQLANQAQQFYVQLHNKGKDIPLFGSDGTDDSSQFHGPGSYVSGFPFDPNNATVNAFANAHGGDTESFGIPTYTSVIANAQAIQAACHANHNSIGRNEVRLAIKHVHLTKAQSLLGFPVSFLAKNVGAFQGVGDMGGSAGFGIYQIQDDGSYKRVG